MTSGQMNASLLGLFELSLSLIGPRAGVVWIFGVDIDLAILKKTDIEWHDGGAAVVDRLGDFGKISYFDALRGERGHVGIEESGAPPLPITGLKGGSVAEEAAGKFSGAVGTCDLIGDRIIEVVRTLATFIGGPSGAEVDEFRPYLDHGGALVTDTLERAALGTRTAAGRIDTDRFGAEFMKVFGEGLELGVFRKHPPSVTEF